MPITIPLVCSIKYTYFTGTFKVYFQKRALSTTINALYIMKQNNTKSKKTTSHERNVQWMSIKCIKQYIVTFVREKKIFVATIFVIRSYHISRP